MLVSLYWLVVAVLFGAASRAAFHQTGIIAPGPILRLLQRGPIPYIIFLSSFSVDREDYGKSEGAMRAVGVFLGIMFAVVCVGCIAFSIVGEPI